MMSGKWEAIDAAIDAAKRVKGLPDDSSALAHICLCHMRLQWRPDGWDRAPDGLASIFAAFLNRLDKNAAREIMKAVHANVTTTSRPSPRLSRPAVERRGVGIIQPAGPGLSLSL